MDTYRDYFSSTWGAYFWLDITVLIIFICFTIAIVIHAVRKYRLSFPPVKPLFLVGISYWMTGMLFGMIYAMYWYFDQSSFRGVQNGGNFEFVYFSFVTITTLGYGDIQPVSYLARWTSVFEACVGVFYAAVLIAILISNRNRTANSSDVQDDKGDGGMGGMGMGM